MKSFKDNLDYIQNNPSKQLERLKEIVHHDNIEFDYVNWKGEKSHRKVQVNEFYYGANEYHPESQWLLDAFDLDKEEWRMFAMKDMSNIKRI